MSASTFAALLQGFFTDRLLRQMRASPNTVSSYRDTFRLLLRFATDRLEKTPSELSLADIEPSLLLDFLDWLEAERSSTARTRANRTSSTSSSTAAPSGPSAFRSPTDATSGWRLSDRSTVTSR